ncbi:hypothetical protein PG990_007194 [Apiospora arundinis]
MPHPTMELLTDSALARRQFIMQRALEIMPRSLGISLDQIRAGLPRVLDLAESLSIQVIQQKPMEDPDRHLAMNGSWSHDFVAWHVVMLLWDLVFENTDLYPDGCREEFLDTFPRPEKQAYPFDNWLPLVTGPPTIAAPVAAIQASPALAPVVQPTAVQPSTAPAPVVAQASSVPPAAVHPSSSPDPASVLLYEDHINEFLTSATSNVCFVEGTSGNGKSTRAIADIWERCYRRQNTIFCIQPTETAARKIEQDFNNRVYKSGQLSRIIAQPTCPKRFGLDFDVDDTTLSMYTGKEFCQAFTPTENRSASKPCQVVVVLDNMAPAKSAYDVLCLEQCRRWAASARAGEWANVALKLIIMVSSPYTKGEVVPFDDFPDPMSMVWKSDFEPEVLGFEMASDNSPGYAHDIRSAILEYGTPSSTLICMMDEDYVEDVEDLLSNPENKNQTKVVVEKFDYSARSAERHIGKAFERLQMVGTDSIGVLILQNDLHCLTTTPAGCSGIICFGRAKKWRNERRSLRFMRMETAMHMNDIRQAIRLSCAADFKYGKGAPKVLYQNLKLYDTALDDKHDCEESPAVELRCCLLTLLFLAVAWWPGQDPLSIPMVQRLYYPVELQEMRWRFRVMGAICQSEALGSEGRILAGPHATRAADILNEMHNQLPNVRLQVAWLLAYVTSDRDKNESRVLLRIASIMMLESPRHFIDGIFDYARANMVYSAGRGNARLLAQHGTPWLMVVLYEQMSTLNNPEKDFLFKSETFDLPGEAKLMCTEYLQMVSRVSCLEKFCRVDGLIDWSEINDVTSFGTTINRIILESCLHNLISIEKMEKGPVIQCDALCEQELGSAQYLDPGDLMRGVKDGYCLAVSLCFEYVTTPKPETYPINTVKIAGHLVDEIEERLGMGISLALGSSMVL